MQNFKSEDLLTLLTHLIIVDHKIFREEIEAFAAAALALRLQSDTGHLLTRRDCYQWFECKIKSIREDATRKEMHEKLLALFHRLQAIPNKQEVLDWLCIIAMSDGAVHVNECLIIALAAGHLDLNPPVWEDVIPSETGWTCYLMVLRST